MPSAALKRHPAAPCAALRGIEVRVARKPQALQVIYVLHGEIDRLRIPAPRPSRLAERLWQHTCCEIFIGRPGRPGYREFNLSPSGEWAAYQFARYRQGGLLTGFEPVIAVERGAQRLTLEASIPEPHQGRLLLGLSVVVEDESGALAYWALRHAPGKPDFHHRDSFALEVDEVRS